MNESKFSGVDFFLSEMIAAIERILHYTEGISFHEYEGNNVIRDAVIRNFEVVGESVRHIPFSLQNKNKHIPWNHMLSFRNFIAHEFFDVDDDIIWSIIHTDLRRNAIDIRQLREARITR